MKKLAKLAALMLVLAMVAMLFAGCESPFRSDEEKIKDRMDDFISACNSGNLDDALDCLDKSSRNTYGAVFNIGNSLLGGLTGIDINVKDLMAVVFGLSPQDLFKMQVQSIRINSEESATVTVSLSITDPQTGEVVTQDGLEIPMIKEKWDWYIDARIDWYALMEELS